MPTYDYSCADCSARFERYTSVSARKRQTCGCGGKLELLFSMPNINIFARSLIADDGRTVRFASKEQYRIALDRKGMFDASMDAPSGSQDHHNKPTKKQRRKDLEETYRNVRKELAT